MGTRIRILRERAGLSQTELGERLGVKQQSVAKWEKGGSLSTARLQALADALDVDVSVLLGQPPGHGDLDSPEQEALKLITEKMRRTADLMDSVVQEPGSPDRPLPITDVRDTLRGVLHQLGLIQQDVTNVIEGPLRQVNTDMQAALGDLTAKMAPMVRMLEVLTTRLDDAAATDPERKVVISEFTEELATAAKTGSDRAPAKRRRRPAAVKEGQDEP